MSWLALREEIAREFDRYEGAGFDFEQAGITFGMKNIAMTDARHRREAAITRRLSPEQLDPEQVKLAKRPVAKCPEDVRRMWVRHQRQRRLNLSERLERQRVLEARHFLPGRAPTPHACECGEAFGTKQALGVHQAWHRRREQS